MANNTIAEIDLTKNVQHPKTNSPSYEFFPKTSDIKALPAFITKA